MKSFIAGLLSLSAIFINASALAQGTSSYPQFEECTAVTSWLMNGKDTHKMDKAKKIKIPEGWKVVGTSIFSDKTPIFYICR